MALEQKQKAIGGFTYTVTQMGALKGRNVYVRLAKILGPALMGKPLEALDKLSEADMSSLCEAFAELSTAESAAGKLEVLGRPEVFDSHFAGRYEEMTEWLLFCVEVNFRSFFDKIRTLGEGASEPETTK